MQTDDPLISQRLAKLELATQRDGDPFWRTRYDVTHHAADIVSGFDQLEGQTVRLAGRLHTLRGKGKAAFWDLYDQSGRIQIFLNVDSVGQDSFTFLGEVVDAGDIVGVEGTVIRTRMGEVSVHASAVTLLTKSLRPPPLGKEKDGET